MKKIALLLLFCLIGGAAAQALSGPQVTRYQGIYLDGPTPASFEPLVERYWNDYVQNAEVVYPAVRDPNTTMSIWKNEFPYSFEKPLQLGSTSFTGGVGAAVQMDPVLYNSLFLERNTVNNFGLENSWTYAPRSFSPAAGRTYSFSAAATQSNVSPSSAQGMIISQNIGNLFGL
ncbi:MAG: hypothetical protein GKC10_02405 [Methanosarcinales archaeon]|nr:hypothetical protein [Methanosarcinales archaeon]